MDRRTGRSLAGTAISTFETNLVAKVKVASLEEAATWKCEWIVGWLWRAPHSQPLRVYLFASMRLVSAPALPSGAAYPARRPYLADRRYSVASLRSCGGVGDSGPFM